MFASSLGLDVGGKIGGFTRDKFNLAFAEGVSKKYATVVSPKSALLATAETVELAWCPAADSRHDMAVDTSV